jgi:diaminopimelate epimerase
MKQTFYKMHSLGNDFIIFDRSRESDDIEKISHRNYGIGADQVFFIDKIHKESGIINIYVSIYNQDGSMANMCINGIRCIVKFLAIKQNYSHIKIKTITKELDGYYDKNKDEVTIELNKKDISCYENVINIGNLHKIFLLENHKDLLSIPNQIPNFDLSISSEYNKNFVYISSQNELSVYTIERGVGLTKACGSGIVASCYYCHKNNLIDDKVIVKTPSFEELKEFATVKFKQETISITSKCYYIAEINYHNQ